MRYLDCLCYQYIVFLLALLPPSTTILRVLLYYCLRANSDILILVAIVLVVPGTLYPTKLRTTVHELSVNWACRL